MGDQETGLQARRYRSGVIALRAFLTSRQEWPAIEPELSMTKTVSKVLRQVQRSSGVERLATKIRECDLGRLTIGPWTVNQQAKLRGSAI
jgi:hypothetical protein